MQSYELTQLRNVALVGPHGAGKTLLAESMIYQSGAIDRLGSIEQGTTRSDYHPSEKQRQMSIFSSLLNAQWQGHKINILDTPGYQDFVGDKIASIRASDLAVIVVNVAAGVDAGAEVAWKHAAEHGRPCMFVLNQIDRGGDPVDVAAKLRSLFGHEVTLLQLPVPGKPGAIVDLLRMKQLTFPKPGEVIAGEIDESLRERAGTLHTELLENVAENDEDLMEVYVERGELDETQLTQGLRKAVAARQLFPVLLTSGTDGTGVARLLSVLAEVGPSPADAPPMEDADGNPIPCDPEAAPLAFVFRTMAEQHVGEYSFVRVCSGTIQAGLELENAQAVTGERLGQLFVLQGQDRANVATLTAGDMGAVVKLKATHTNNTLRAKGSKVVVKPIQFPEPLYPATLRVNGREEDKLARGLHQLVEEDPSLRVLHDDLHQLMLAGMGEMHLEIAKFRLKNRFGVEVDLEVPRISYRETVRKQARARYRHKKQTGGAGQFAEIAMIVEPLQGEFQAPEDIKVRSEDTVQTAWGAKLQVLDAVVGGVIDMRRFHGAIEKGILETMQSGPLAGYPIYDVRVVVFDGKMHSVDSNEAAFKAAARMCFKDAFSQAAPGMLEPLYSIEVNVPDEYTGDVMSDLNVRRAQIQGIESEDHIQRITARVPQAELLRYSTALRSITQGRAGYKTAFLGYQQLPENIQQELMAAKTEAKE